MVAPAKNLQEIELDEKMRASYLDYAMSVIVSRALPDVRDGLKPVHRRVLYGMLGLGLRHNVAFRKSATVVGEVLGKYHPHGDAAVYDALVRMAQDFNMRYPLVEGQGNFGSIDGDNPAAMRYTEVRLTELAEELLADIDKATVPFVDNFDGRHQQPVVLPARLPNLLLNGSDGIAVGMATKIPPHNLAELIDAITVLIENPDASVEEFVAVMPGPDFPGGGLIIGREGIAHAYATGSGNPLTVTALDARSGRQLWRWTREQPVRNPYEINRSNRGVAVLGHRLFLGTLDAALIALDARTGLPLWNVQVADTMEGYSITSPPLALKDKIIVGVSGGEFGTRGFIDAYAAATGTRLWRFYTVPGPGEFGHDTWKGDSWQRGGSAPWLTGSYDPQLNLVYWSVGNPAPFADRSVRGDGDNLFSCSVLALDADTGQRKWHYQFTPNDGHDWDSAQDMILADRVWHGQRRKLLLHADRNAFLYALDRVTGTFLQATPFVHQTWNQGFDANGRPIAVPGSNSSPEGSILVYPTLGGGTNFQAPSYSLATGLLYLAYSEGGAQFVGGPAEYERGRQYVGGGAGRGVPPARGANEPPPSAGIKAIDPESGRTIWDFKIFQGSLTNGVLATAGGVVFAGIRDGNFAALDAKTGKPLWHVQMGANLAASPIMSRFPTTIRCASGLRTES